MKFNRGETQQAREMIEYTFRHVCASSDVGESWTKAECDITHTVSRAAFILTEVRVRVAVRVLYPDVCRYLLKNVISVQCSCSDQCLFRPVFGVPSPQA